MSKVFIPYLLFMGMQCLAGCEAPEDGEPHRLPYRMKFDLADVGMTHEFRVYVEKFSKYAVSVDFYIRERNEYSHFLDQKETREESAYLFKMMGSERDPKTHQWRKIGAPASFRVQVARDADRHQLIDQVVTRPPTMGTYMGRTAKLAYLELPSGEYTVRLTYLDGISDLFRLKGNLAFYNTTPPK